MNENGACFAFAKNDREPGRAANPLDAGDEFKFAVKDLLVKEQQSAEGLVLSGGCDSAINREVAEEGGDLVFAHIRGVTLFVEQDEASDPVDVSLLSANAVTLDAQMPADALEEFAWWWAGGGRRRIFRDAKCSRFGTLSSVPHYRGRPVRLTPSFVQLRCGKQGRLPPVVAGTIKRCVAHGAMLWEKTMKWKEKSDGAEVPSYQLSLKLAKS